MLCAAAITKSYDIEVLHCVDLAIEDGQFVVVMGPSGSGKSTLLHLLAGMDSPTSGSVQLDGQELTTLSQKELAHVRLTRLGFVFQQPRLMQSLTILDNIVLPGLMTSRPKKEVVQRAEWLLEQGGISSIAGHSPLEVSGGQLQRAGIARALINEPAIIFGDEPTGALNRSTAAKILDLLGEINRAGTTLVVVTHDPLVAMRADRVVMLVDGRISGDLTLGGFHGDPSGTRLAAVMELMQHHGI